MAESIAEPAARPRFLPAQTLQHAAELDALRGLAIALVYCYHADMIVRYGPQLSTDWSGTLVSPLTAFVRAGSTGVDLFFVLSGFLLGRAFLVEAADGPRVDRARYFARRALRILPLYTLVVLAGTMLAAERPTDLLRAVPWLLFLEPLTTQFPNVSSVWWSLTIEVQFYLLLPLLPWVLRGGTGVLAAVAAGAAYGAFVGGLFTRGLGLGVLSNTIVGRAPLLLWGIGAAALHAWYGERLRARRETFGRAGGLAADVLLAGVMVTLAYLLRWAVATGLIAVEIPPRVAWHVLVGALWAAVILLVLVCPGPLGRLLLSRPLAGLGVISYSVYLLHWPLLAFTLGRLQRADPGYFGWHPPAVLAVALATLGCLLLATATYVGIERPAMRWRPRRDGEYLPLNPTRLQ